jgi:hypothetical protein
MRQQLLKAGLTEKVVTASKKILDQAEQKAKEVLHCDQPQPDKGCDVEVRYIFQVGRTNSAPQVRKCWRVPETSNCQSIRPEIINASLHFCLGGLCRFAQ